MPLRAVAFLACVTTAVGSPSPFLREHAKDGVAWHPWADATFDRARRDRRPLLIVIGRAPSDRCRIRLGEVVTDPAVLEALERRFVPVLVDRDERPDLADAASLALGLLGANETGLPMALVLTPEARPLAGRSLAPPGAADRLRALLLRSAGDWAERRGAAEAFAGANAAALREAQAPAPGRAPLAREVVDRALRGLAESFDAKHGGFGVAPKAIPHGALRLLLAEHARTGRPETLRPAVVTLLAMAGGALRDRTTGAFHSEALDDDWRVAASEATLADNALLLRAYTLAHEATGEALLREAALGIAGWARGSMRDSGGGFQAATWRDPAGDEGRDPRVFAGANGLVIGALATSGARLVRPDDLEGARAAASAVLARLGPATSLRRYALGDSARGSAFLEDYAGLAEGLLDLAEATREGRWRHEAQALVDAALARFSDPEGRGFFDTDDGPGRLLVRTRSAFDGGLPSANGVFASVLLRLASGTGESRYGELARRSAEAFRGELQQAPSGMETMAEAVAELLGPARPAAAPAALASRAVAGPVTLEAELVPPRAKAGDAVLGRVHVRLAEGWHVNAHRPGPKDLVGLTVSIPGEGMDAAPPRYPEPTFLRRRFSPETAGVHAGEAAVTVALRIPAGAHPGPLRVRFRAAFQACRGEDCRPPESVLLEAPLEVLP